MIPEIDLGRLLREERGLDGPDVDAIFDLHRAPESYVRFLYKPDPNSGELRPLPYNYGSIKVERLRGMFPVIREFLLHDSYYSINSFYRGATGKTKHLSYLNAAFVDCDCHRFQTNFLEALIMVLQALYGGVIPLPSVIVRSGRGLWLLYMLEDRKTPGRGQRTYPGGREVLTYLAVNRELQRRLAAAHPRLGADANASDASRVTRVPGSLHTGAMSFVRYLVLANDNGESPLYRLDELAGFFGLFQLVASPPPLETPRTKTGKAPKRRSGALGMNERRLREFQMIRQLRGGFRCGHRNAAALIYSVLLRACNHSPAEIEQRVLELARECKAQDGLQRAPLSDLEALRAVESATKKRLRYEGATISARLGITAAEADYLELHYLHPSYVSTSGRDYQRKTPADKVETRRAAIMELIAENGGRPIKQVEMIQLLRERRGIIASAGTVNGDYKALEIKKKAGFGPAENFGASPLFGVEPE